MGFLESWLVALPAVGVYLAVGLIIGLESMGIPLPGELTLVTATLLAVEGVTQPWAVALAAATGAIVGDSIGYAVGRRGGRGLLERLGRRFPEHLGRDQIAKAERTFARWGVWAVFFGRFVALLRILAGPLAGALRVPYRTFLLANASGGILWASGTTALVYWLGRAAQHWLKDFSWAALGLAILVGLGTTWYIKRRATHRPAAELVTTALATTAPAAAGAVDEG